MGRWHDGEGGLAHCEGIRQAHRRGEVGATRICDGPVLGSAMLREASWSRSNFSWGTFLYKRPNVTLAASSEFDQRSMTISVSSRILEIAEESRTTRELAPERKGPEWPALWTARRLSPTDVSSQLCSVS